MSRFSPKQRFGLLVLAAVEIGMFAAAQIDIHRRPADQIHGSKTFWRLICLLNIIGPASYFRWGRQPARTT